MTEKEKKAVEIPEKHHNYPKVMLLGGLIIAVVALISLFNWFNLPKTTMDILLLIAGLWLLFAGLAKGMYKQRKEKLKEYI
jgi:uncharacterized membrane protein HdeD (DUF308 family)